MLENRFREIKRDLEELFNRVAATDIGFKHFNVQIKTLTKKIEALAKEQQVIVKKLTALERQTQGIDAVVFQGTMTEGQIELRLSDLCRRVSDHDYKLSGIT